jgi:hypothetical protein
MLRRYWKSAFFVIAVALVALWLVAEKHEDAVTAFATVFIAFFTWTIWLTNKSQLDHAQKVERACEWRLWGFSQRPHLR